MPTVIREQRAPSLRREAPVPPGRSPQHDMGSREYRALEGSEETEQERRNRRRLNHIPDSLEMMWKRLVRKGGKGRVTEGKGRREVPPKSTWREAVVNICGLWGAAPHLLPCLPGSSVHGILQARTLEWVTMPSARGSSQPRD